MKKPFEIKFHETAFHFRPFLIFNFSSAWKCSSFLQQFLPSTCANFKLCSQNAKSGKKNSNEISSSVLNKNKAKKKSWKKSVNFDSSATELVKSSACCNWSGDYLRAYAPLMQYNSASSQKNFGAKWISHRKLMIFIDYLVLCCSNVAIVYVVLIYCFYLWFSALFTISLKASAKLRSIWLYYWRSNVWRGSKEFEACERDVKEKNLNFLWTRNLDYIHHVWKTVIEQEKWPRKWHDTERN